MDETKLVESGKYILTNHRVTSVVNRLDKKLKLEFFKGQLTIMEVS